jgi:hypothetical protein
MAAGSVGCEDAVDPDGEKMRRECDFFRPFMTRIRKVDHNGDTTYLSFIASPTRPKETRIFSVITRDHALDQPDEVFSDFTVTVLEQDRLIVESQRPEEIPVDLRNELHLKLPDATGIAFRELGQIEHVEAYWP